MSGTTTTTNTAPWANQQPYLTTGWAGAQNLLQNGVPQYYSGSTVAPLSDYRQPAMNAAWSLGNDGTAAGAAIQNSGTGLLANGAQNFAGMGTMQNIAGGQYLNGPQSGGAMGQQGANVLNRTANGAYTQQQNPHLQGMLTNVLNAARPTIQGQFAAAGRTGSGAEANALADASVNAAANLGYQDYSRERGLQQQAATTLGQMDLSAFGMDSNNRNFALGQMGQAAQSMGSLDLNARNLGGQQAQYANQDAFNRVGLLGNVANFADARNQANTDADVARWNFGQNAPWDANQRYMQMVGGQNWGGTGTQQATQTQSGTQNLMQWLALINGGASLFGGK